MYICHDTVTIITRMSRWEGVGSAWGKVHGPRSKERYSVSDIMA